MAYQMSLPSINEMFPEHMMQTWYDGQRDPSHAPASPAHSPVGNQLSGEQLVPRPEFSQRQPQSAEFHRSYNPQPAPQPAQSYRHPRLEGAHDPETFASRRPHQAQFHPLPADPHALPSSPYSFDLLRPHPLTASLETVATSTNVALQPRAAYAGYPGPADRSPDLDPAALQRVRPAFRVHMSPEAARDNAMVPPIHIPVDYTRSYQDPSGYPENQYLASPVSSSNPQSLYRMGSAQSPSAPNCEEKKHCCPHCNKRFNRPSSLNIHVNTHTGAKPFQCPFPGCSRRFNVNSNMRRHWRNHLTNSRRRDAVARLVEPTAPTMPPTPPLSTSPTDTPISQFSGSLPSSASSGSSTPLPSRSPSPAAPYHFASDEEDEMHADERVSYDQAGPGTQGGRGTFLGERSAAVPGLSGDRRRLRSRSSPVPRFRDESGNASAYAHGHHHHSGPGPLRARSSSCTVPGCECQPVSTTLRPAFPSSSIRSSKSIGNP